MVERSAVIPVRDAVVAAINGGSMPTGATGQAILQDRRVWRGGIPVEFRNAVTAELEEKGRGYFLVTGSDEADSGYYAAIGHTGRVRIQGWFATEDDALRGYAWLKALATGALPLGDGHTMITGSVQLSTTQPDQEGKAHQAVMDYAVESIQ